jgi:hypothetical protein
VITKNDLRDAILYDCKIAQALIAKLPDGAADYRPTPGQRSTLELAQYLCKVGQGCTHAGLDGNFDWFGSNSERYDALTLDQIPAALDEEMAEITRLFDGMSDDDFANNAVDMQAANMGKWSMQGWLLATTLKFTTAYKMQLFLYAKASGNTDLDTWDAWMDTGGVPRPQPVETT